MSTINTSGVNINYPIPGINNNSQGFRDNFAAIKTNLDTAGTEITNLQQNVVVKSALAGTTVNNNMNDTLISNALTKSFRATTYNLGNALSGTVLVDVSNGDVQYGTIAANTTLAFSGWAVAGLQSNVELQLAVSNAVAVITFPSQISSNNCYGITTIESYANVGGFATVTIPYGVCEVDYRLSSTDCGNTIHIEQFNRPRKSTEMRLRNPIPTGYVGDVTGTFSTDPVTATSINITNTTVTTNVFTTSDTTGSFYLDQPVIFTGTTFGGVSSGTTYYIRTIPSATEFTLSTSPGTVSGPASAVSLSTVGGNMTLTSASFVYVATGPFNSTATAINTVSANTVGNTIVMASGTGLANNAPIVFTGTNFSVIEANVIYYVASVSSANISISRTRFNGIAGQQVLISANAAGVMTGTCFVGDSIWKRMPLTSW